MEIAFNNAQQIYNKFEWYYKKEFQWIYINHNDDSQRTVFLGSKDNLSYAVILKSIKVYLNIYKPLLKEAYFLACVKNNIYFTEIVELFTSDDCQNMYIIMRDEGINLKDFIKYNNFDYNKKIENISRFIVFQTVCGLKFLHDNEFCHNDIKLTNIVISGACKPKICDLGSISKNQAVKGGGTNGYLSPQAILDFDRTQKDDMYAVGIVFLELLNRQTGIFKINGVDDKKQKLKEILEKFYDIKHLNGNWNDNINYNIIVNLIEIGNYNDFEYKLKSNLFRSDENENNKELIRNLLEINPERRMTTNQVINLEMFTNLNFRFEGENNNMKFKEEDYNKYMNSSINDFMENIEEIREKVHGDTLLRIGIE